MYNDLHYIYNFFFISPFLNTYLILKTENVIVNTLKQKFFTTTFHKMNYPQKKQVVIITRLYDNSTIRPIY